MQLLRRSERTDLSHAANMHDVTTCCTSKAPPYFLVWASHTLWTLYRTPADMISTLTVSTWHP